MGAVTVAGAGGTDLEAVIQCNRVHILVNKIGSEIASVSHFHQLYHLSEPGCVIFMQAEVPHASGGAAHDLRMRQCTDRKWAVGIFFIKRIPG